MDDHVVQLKERLGRLLKEAAEIELQIGKADGTVKGVCHYSVIEARAHELGRQLSRTVQAQQLEQWSFTEGQRMNCPTCGTSCEAQRKTFAEDPQPDPPECFCDVDHVAKIAETEALSLAAPLPENASPRRGEPAAPPAAEPPDWRPKRLVRTVLSSLAEAKEFGCQMHKEAKRRRFFEAAAKVFLGDGLAWNWSIWKQHFREFTPILDFIHVLSYLFLTAKALHATAADAWSQYLVWMRGCWQGDVNQVLDELAY